MTADVAKGIRRDGAKAAARPNRIPPAKPLSLDARLLDVLKAHKQQSEYTQPADWMFASPDQNGMLPRSYTCFYEKLGKVAGAWLPAVPWKILLRYLPRRFADRPKGPALP
jgi:hypothetical protein